MAQWLKALEEVDGLRDGIKDNDREAVKDAIGDIMVTLIMQTQAWNTDLTECMEQAYKEIADRTGKMVDGVFVKDED
jgi:NTP pyrophosphatase (non-canonical NTP hydrolase)